MYSDLNTPSPKKFEKKGAGRCGHKINISHYLVLAKPEMELQQLVVRAKTAVEVQFGGTS